MFLHVPERLRPHRHMNFNAIRFEFVCFYMLVDFKQYECNSISDSYVCKQSQQFMNLGFLLLKLRLPVLIKGFKAFRIQVLDQITSINLTILKPQINKQFNQLKSNSVLLGLGFRFLNQGFLKIKSGTINSSSNGIDFYLSSLRDCRF